MPDNKKKNKMEYGIRMLKRDARGSLKRHYLFFVVACLLAVFMDAEFITSDYLINMRSTFFDMFSNSSITVEVNPETEEKIKEGVKALDNDAGVFRNNVEKQLENVNRKLFISVNTVSAVIWAHFFSDGIGNRMSERNR